MARKRVFNWKKLCKFKRRWFNNFQWRPSSRTTSMPRPPDMDMRTPEYPDPDRINQIMKSVGGLFSGPDLPIIPFMILDEGNGSYCLLFLSTYVLWNDGRCSLNLPQSQVLELPSHPQHETRFTIYGQYVTFATLSIKRRLHYEPIKFGLDVTMNQCLYLFDFRYDSPWIEKGTVTFVDDMHFIFDARPNERYMYGALVFDEDQRLVGVVYNHVGSPKAIQISYLRKRLEGMIPMPERIGGGGGAGGLGAGPSSSSGYSSSSVS